MAEQAICAECGEGFTVPDGLRKRFPGWTPARCARCHARSARDDEGAADPPRRDRPRGREANLAPAEVLERYSGGPQDGVFTDGSADPNPGPGGWGAVYVVDGQVVDEVAGSESRTTNNRMELKALIEGVELVPEGTPATIYSDSRLVVDTITKWAHGWARAGWRRKTGPVQNLDLVKDLYERMTRRPELEVSWIKAHSGARWNEYADALSTAYRRSRK